MAVGFIIYSNTFFVPFIFDDAGFIYENPAIKNFEYLKNPLKIKELYSVPANFRVQFITRFVSQITFALNYRLHGLNVTGYHIVNLAIHLTNALLVYFLLRVTFKAPSFSPAPGAGHSSGLSGENLAVALLTSLIFVSHPVQTQAVTYVAQRFTSFVTTFYVLSLVLYAQYRLAEPRTLKRILYAGSVISAMCAMFTKENAFTLPLMIVLYEFMICDGKIKDRWLSLMPFIATMVILPAVLAFSRDIVSQLAFQKEDSDYRGITRWDYFFTQFRVIVTYLRLLALPINQNLLHDYPVYHSLLKLPVLFSLAFLSTLMGIAAYLFHLSRNTPWEKRGSLRLISFGIAWFFVALSVESSIIKLDNVIYEHRLYLPSIGVISAVVTTVIWTGKRLVFHLPFAHKLAIFTAAFIVFQLSGLTYARNNEWRDGVRFWEDAVRKSPQQSRVHVNLAQFYEKNNRIEDAAREYQSATDLQPENFTLYSPLAVAYGRLGKFKEAERTLLRALELKPAYALTHVNLGVLYDKTGRFEDAVREFLTALQLDPSNAYTHMNLGVVYARKGLMKEAEKELLIAISLNPDIAEARKYLQAIRQQ